MEGEIVISFTDIMALIGALSGISSILWNAIQWKKDTAKIEVTARIKDMIYGEHVKKSMIAITIKIAGKRPVNISSIGGKNIESELIIKN